MKLIFSFHAYYCVGILTRSNLFIGLWFKHPFYFNDTSTLIAYLKDDFLFLTRAFLRVFPAVEWDWPGRTSRNNRHQTSANPTSSTSC